MWQNNRKGSIIATDHSSEYLRMFVFRYGEKKTHHMSVHISVGVYCGAGEVKKKVKKRIIQGD